MKQMRSPYGYRQGAWDGIPIGLGYFFVSFGFGISAVGEGLRYLETLLISMLNLTSAGQVAGVTVIVAGGTLIEMVLTQLVINLRYSLMGIALTQKLDVCATPRHRLLMSFGLTDEIFAMAASKPCPVGPNYFYGLMTFPYIGWAGGTLCGAVAGQLLPPDLHAAMGILIYTMFVAIVVPPMQQNRGVFLVVLLSAALSCCIEYLPIFDWVSSGFAIIICSVLSAALLALLLPLPEEKETAREDDEYEN